MEVLENYKVKYIVLENKEIVVREEFRSSEIMLTFDILRCIKYNGFKFSPVEKQIYAYLYSIKLEKGKVFPSLQRIMYDLGIDNNKTLHNNLESLVAKGLILKINRGHGKNTLYEVYDLDAAKAEYRGPVKFC